MGEDIFTLTIVSIQYAESMIELSKILKVN
jgi:hypothetical protein